MPPLFSSPGRDALWGYGTNVPFATLAGGVGGAFGRRCLSGPRAGIVKDDKIFASQNFCRRFAVASAPLGASAILDNPGLRGP